MEYLRKYNTATHVYIPMIKRGVVDFAVGADWTPAAGDVKISIDGGAVANITSLPTAITSGNTAVWDFSLSAAELTGRKIDIIISDASPKAIEDTMFSVATYGNASAEVVFDLSTATVVASSVSGNVVGSVGSIGTGGIAAASFAAGAIDASAIAADAIGSSELAASAANEIRDAVWAQTMTELSAIPGVTGSILEALEFLFLLSKNKVTQTSTTQTLRNAADSASIGTAAVSDDGTTFTKNAFS